MSQTPHNINSPPPAQVSEPPHVGGVRAGPALAGLLYLLLVVSFGLALWAQGSTGRLPEHLKAVVPWAFLAFAAAFTAYRLALVRARKYPAFKAFFQIATALVFFTLLLPGARGRYEREAQHAKGELVGLLADRDPHVRALAAEVARHRPDGVRYAHALVERLRDADPAVRAEAHRSLVAVTGTDLGAPDNPAGLAAWEARYP